MGKDGAALESQYRLILEHLDKQHGLLGLVFRMPGPQTRGNAD